MTTVANSKISQLFTINKSAYQIIDTFRQKQRTGSSDILDYLQKTPGESGTYLLRPKQQQSISYF